MKKYYIFLLLIFLFATNDLFAGKINKYQLDTLTINTTKDTKSNQYDTDFADDEFDDLFLEDEDFINQATHSENSIEETISDRHEVTNRSIHRFNESIDHVVLAPIARGYRYITPKWGRDRVRNFIANLQTPVSLFNSIIQLNGQASLTNFWRFVINSSFGVGGIIDVSTMSGLEPDPQDFGRTLAHWDINDGEYIVLPFFGPSTYRDATGKLVDSVINPFGYLVWQTRVGLTAVNIISDREHILDITDEIYRTSFDPYSSIKSAYLQYRAKNK